MPIKGWKQLLAGEPWFGGAGSYPIAAYSEFMPPPRLVRKAYGLDDPPLLDEMDPWGWPVTEYEEAFVLKPGLDKIAHQLVCTLAHLGHGRGAHGISLTKLTDNRYFPRSLCDQTGKLQHERYVVLLPLALSRTQDDKGRVLWTAFGGSEQGPARAFWKSFYTAPGKEVPAEQAVGFLRRLLNVVYGEALEKLADLRAAGFRILPQEADVALPHWCEGPLPKWTAPYLWARGQQVKGVRYLLTFRRFEKLPAPVQQAYLAGTLNLIPFPGSLLFWGIPSYDRLAGQIPLATQIPLLHSLTRHEGPHGIRIPQSGWFHEPHPDQPEPSSFHGPLRNTFRRTHRNAKVHRDENELAQEGRDDKLLHVLFSTTSEDLGLYGKPMARNIQIWTREFKKVLDGPRANRLDLDEALRAVRDGGHFGYRFQFPAMRVGQHELYWHRPLVAYLSPQTGHGEVVPGSPTGYLTAYDADRPNLDHPVELWPRFLQRPEHVAALELFAHAQEPRPHRTTINIRKLLDTSTLVGKSKLPASFARHLLTIPKHETLPDWLTSLPARAHDTECGSKLRLELQARIRPDSLPRSKKRRPPKSLTFEQTARRSFEVAYWKTIAELAEGTYRNKNNADCVRDPATQAALAYQRRDLDPLGDYLVSYYTQQIATAKMSGKALVGELPFHWLTDFSFPLFGGWLKNQEGWTHERDLIVVIPGRNRRRAVIMGDHYDTAYMLDHYDPHYGGTGARVAAAGADDNHSATATLMRAAPIFLELSRKGRLACDIWLIHLTGEEFPADCLGARHLTQSLVEGTLQMRLPGGKYRDLSGVRVQGVYVLDMVAHNNVHDRDIFQISPGTTRESMWLAYQAHQANMIWNASVPLWNKRSARRGCGRAQRCPDGSQVPETALHLELHGEIRPYYDPRSTLYNTDGQVFSDAGVPVVLFMENYDINREGYHDSHDTMENIDLDYGAGVAAIAIESVARAATEKPRF
jgi:hypothetical protein